MSHTVLIVEDEVSILTLLEYNLAKAGYETITVCDGENAIQEVEKQQPDVLLLDIMLPKLSGLDVCKKLREKRCTMPIIMITAKDEEFDKVLGLELGADDYITKPFSPREVVARVKAVLRRMDLTANPDQGERKFTVGEIEIYPDRYETYDGEKEVVLTPKQFELLVYLAENKGRVLSREQLLNAVWDYEFDGDTRIVDVHVSHLREKLEQDTKNPAYIRTIRGFGYKLESPEESNAR
ncbi:MAG TPA: response regulator transcription factor [Bacillales bacterium]|nr:response regulator transcription factor [Bacillales bacterium]